ncbi:hypothetical protein SAMN05192534_1573 [Alteribacillus persepolensis]|uniref:Lipoprotein n=1 Tax=Alteribacillus persepolensis TaxID=568899 RepID=A0A1G8KML9_9BACI|nr:hypothetical protein [Alteribacillus persepolensis]SDI44648.1 hypothetical protein SAMN05192534_1573 [Alteribacillus persepolensis]
MKKMLLPIMVLLITTLLLMACGDENNQSGSNDNTPESQTENEDQQVNGEDSSQINKKEDKSETKKESGESATNDSIETFSEETKNEESNNTLKSKEDNALSKYSSDEIEYARVWLQLGPNQDIDELNVRHIPAGKSLNPDDETSANYPEDVVQLSGSRLVDGSVTYSSNGNGTINVYKVPLRWDGKNPAGEDVYKDIIKNTKTETIDRGDDQKIINLIKLLGN